MEKQGQGASGQGKLVSRYFLMVEECFMVNMVEKKEGWHFELMLFSMDVNMFMMFVNSKELSSNWSHLHQFVESGLMAGILPITESRGYYYL